MNAPMTALVMRLVGYGQTSIEYVILNTAMEAPNLLMKGLENGLNITAGKTRTITITMTIKITKSKLHRLTSNRLYQAIFIFGVAAVGVYIILYFKVFQPGVERLRHKNNTVQQSETKKITPTTNQPSPKVDSNPQATQSNNSKQPTNQNSSGKIVPGVCTKTVIPQSTVYEDVGYLYIGETRTYPGMDGWRQTCTASSNGFKPEDVVFQGLPTKIYRGTKPRPEATPTPTNNYSYSQALSTAQGQCSPIAQASGTGSSSYQLCIQTVLKQYGY